MPATAEKSSHTATQRAMKAAVDMEVNAALSTTTAAKAIALDEHFPGYDDMATALKAFFAAGKDIVKAGGGAPTRWDDRKLTDAWQAARDLLAKAEARP